MKKTLIICDFDGTVNSIDIGSNILRELLPQKYDQIDRIYQQKKITNFEIYKQILGPAISLDGANLSTLIKKYIRQTSGFSEFAKWVNDKSHDITIVSDGFDLYINEFLKRHDLNISFYSNRLFRKDGVYQMEFPYHNESCFKCGSCKSEIIKGFRKNYKELIYVGDGLSDLCSSRHVDVFFARRRIFNEIETKSRFYFRDFNDLKKIMSKRGGYRAVFFDLDGTLVDGFDIIYESFNYALNTLGLKELPVKKIKKVIGPALSEGFRKIVPQELVEEGVRLYRAYYKERYLQRTVLFKEVKDILGLLRDNGIMVGLITNKKVSFAKELLDYLDVSKYFNFITGAEEGYLPKPDSEIMEKIKKDWRLESHEIIYVGDSITDGLFSRNSGCDFIALGVGLGSERELYRYSPLTFCKDLKELNHALIFLLKID